MYFEKRKKSKLKRSNGDNCAFCVVILCECLVSHKKKAPELTTLQRHQVRSFREPFFGGEVVVILPGLSQQLVVQQTKYHPGKKKCKLCAEKMECICKPTLFVVDLVELMILEVT